MQLTLLREKKHKHRRARRAIDPKQFHHVTLKAAHRPVLRRNHVAIRRLVREAQDRFAFRLRTLSIMENHIHLLIQVPNREAFANAMRFLAGQIALKTVKGKLWTQRVWSRVVKWGRDLRAAETYINANPLVAGCFDDTDVFQIRAGLLLIPRCRIRPS